MKKILTSDILQKYCEEINKTPAFIGELSNYEKQAVLEFAKERIRQEEKDIIHEIIRDNPDYVYPEEYKDRHLDHFKAISSTCQFFNRIIYFLHHSEIKTTPQPEPGKTNPSSSSAETKPIFKPEEILIIYNVLKPYFASDQQPELKKVLKTGGNTALPLFFMDNGNRIAYAFRRLKEENIITGCNKKELGAWLILNFTYKNKKREKTHFKESYTEKLFTQQSPTCKNYLTFILSDGKKIDK